MIIPKAKDYEKPNSGLYHGILADIVDLGMVTTTFNNVAKSVPMVRFVWILNVNGKDGKPLTVAQRYNVSSQHEKSNVYKALKQILSAPPAVGLDIDTLIGQVRKILINRETSADGQKDFANIMGILPGDPGVTVAIPADFVLDRNKPLAEQAKNRATQTVRPPQAAQPAQPAAPASSGDAVAAALAAQVAALQLQLAAQTASPGAAPAAPATQGADVAF